jgi:hypothetical protein
MICKETEGEIRRLYHAKKWPGWTLESTGAAAAEAGLRQTLGATSGLWLRAEFSNSIDNSWLDNFNPLSQRQQPLRRRVRHLDNIRFV